MIITNQFVMLNYPKTGSSFARAMLKQVHNYDRGGVNKILHRMIRKFRYGTVLNRTLRKIDTLINPDMTELIVPKVYGRHIGYRQSQHGRYSQVPEEHKDKTIISIIRNPFTRYVSTYLYEDWKDRYPQIYSDQLKNNIPSFPDLSFAEYYDMIHFYKQDLRLQGIIPKINLGVNTIQFIRFYFKEPKRVLNEIDDEYITNRSYQEEMVPITFLHQERLNDELFQFLLTMGYSEQKIQFIKDAEPINVTKRKRDQQSLDRFYTEELRQNILKRDRLLFKIFPEYQP
ncbi:MAG: sulfotransferase family 2 domain-containing protein [Chloroflexi bacterium]|jgi:hypothetical protein|nr:sulfotransferase family 2 domain-containing protein [Chloroflexota bacterium]